jgi:hypothetical protein
MVCPSELQLGAPLWLFAIMIVRFIWESRTDGTGPEPPRFQSVRGYTCLNCSHTPGAARSRKTHVKAAVEAVTRLFIRCAIVAPAGVCSSAGPGHGRRLDKMPRWVSWIDSPSPNDVVSILVDSVRNVPDAVFNAIEAEYNTAIVASKQPALAHLHVEPGSLASLIEGMKHTVAVTPYLAVAPSPDAHRGSFYYIGAGVGCGIREAQQVSAFPNALFCLLRFCLYCNLY